MPTEDQRERDQMWKRIDANGRQINDLERGLTEVKSNVDEQGRSISDLSSAVQKAEAATNQVHLDMNTLIGQGQAMKRVVMWLSAILVIIQLYDAFATELPGIPL